jgi:integrase
VKLPRTVKVRVDPLPVSAVEAIRAEMPARLQSAVTLAAGAGLRQGEVLGVTVDRVDFLRRELTIDRQLVTVTGREPHLGPPKTTASARTIPLPKVVTDELAEHLSRWPTHGLLFTTEADSPWRRNQFSEVWRAACQRTEWPTANFHDLRHHHASVLIGAGCSVKVVQAQLGHANASETLDTYAHLWPEDDERVRQAVDAAFSRPARGLETA